MNHLRIPPGTYDQYPWNEEPNRLPLIHEPADRQERAQQDEHADLQGVRRHLRPGKEAEDGVSHWRTHDK